MLRCLEFYCAYALYKKSPTDFIRYQQPLVSLPLKPVVVLYMPGKYFACRNCDGLGYPTQKEGVGNRTASKADKLRRRLD